MTVHMAERDLEIMESNSDPKINNEKSSDWLLDNIAEASKNARGIYLLYIGFLAYCALTIISTTDRQIFLNEGVHLPVIEVNISLVGFFLIAPIIAIFIFVYLQLSIKYIILLIDDVTNGQINKKRLYPWMVTLSLDLKPKAKIKGEKSKTEDDKPDTIVKLRKIIVNISLFWFLPLVLILFPLWILKKHDLLLTVIIGLYPLIGTLIVCWLWHHYSNCDFKTFFKENIGSKILLSFVIIFTLFFYMYMIPKAFDASSKIIFLRPWLYVDLSYQNLITERNTEYESLSWMDLQNAQLQGANLAGTILKKANLSRAQLKGAYLLNTNLQGADLWEANLQDAGLLNTKLQNANLGYAKLQDATLWSVKLQDANLSMANLQGAALDNANLHGADLSMANLQGANLYKAQLDSADFREANLQSIFNLTSDQLAQVRTLFKAQVDKPLREELEKTHPHLFEPPKELSENNEK